VHLDFDEIRRNAIEQGIDLSQITIIYEELNDNQFEALNAGGLVVTDLGDGNAIGRFKANGDVLFPEMATGVLYLGA
jgi:hypothetical protein